MMIKYFLMFSILFLPGKQLAARQIEPIQTDRPDQTESPFTVPVKHFQMETGFSFEKINKDEKSIVYPSVLYKYGINNQFEFRLITEFTTEKIYGKKLSGLQPVTVGFKINIAKEKGLLPTTSFIGHLTFPLLAAQSFKATYYAPAFRFTMQHTLSKKLSLSYNLGAEWDGESAVPTFIYTLTSGYSISEKLGAYIEVYGFAPQKLIADHRFDCGITYLLKTNILVDVSGGFGVSDNAPDYYAALGFSFRLKD